MFWIFVVVVIGMIYIGLMTKIIKFNDENDLRNAIRKGDKKAAIRALDAGVAPDSHIGLKFAKDQEPALIHACASNKTDIAIALIERGADVCVRGNKGLTALHCAASSGNLPLVDVLLTRGADSNAALDETDDEGAGFPPIAIALGKGHTEVVRRLLAAGANPNMRFGINAMTPMFIAALGLPASLAAMRLAYEAGGEINTRNRNGMTVLHVAINMEKFSAVQTLIEMRADINASENQGLSPISYAANKGAFQVVETLINAGAKVSPVDVGIAAARGFSRVEKLLREAIQLEKPSDPT